MTKLFNRLAGCVVLVASLSCGAVVAQEAAGDATGTDPRAFTSKLMPYALYTELENDMEIKQVNLFGMYAFSPDIAMTYDLPVWKEVDAGGVSGPFPPFLGPSPGGGFGPDIPSDKKADGIGDLGLRFFFKPGQLQFEKSSHMIGAELTLPTATEKVLGGDAWILSPMYVYVRDVKLISPGFVAFMNFFDFDIAKEDNSRPDTRRFRGRWFLMQPLSKPGPGLFDGLYLLPEAQPVYDFEENEFSFWVAPELGKMLPWGAVYAKPGFGIDNSEDGDRDFTFEIGFRYFF